MLFLGAGARQTISPQVNRIILNYYCALGRTHLNRKLNEEK